MKHQNTVFTAFLMLLLYITETSLVNYCLKCFVSAPVFLRASSWKAQYAVIVGKVLDP